MNNLARARAYLSRVPGAVSGAGGHDVTFSVACATVRFGLSDGDAWDLLTEFNSRCQPPWSERELRHKLEDARRTATPGELATSSYRNGNAPRNAPDYQPHRPAPRPITTRPAAQPAPAARCPDVEPEDLPAPMERGALALLRTLYSADECVRIVRGVHRDGDDRETPEDAGTPLPVREWIAKAEARGGDLASLWSSSSGAGVYVAMNPVRPGGTRDDDVASYRFALVESDTDCQRSQWARIKASKAPVAAVIDSAGKSVHAWVRVDAKDAREYAERVAFLHSYFPGADPKNKNPGRLSRLPDAKRKGKRQRLLALNIGCDSWSEWMSEVQRQTLGPSRTFGDLCALDTSADPNCVIGFRDGKTLRYLCRGKSAWLLGPSGIGKSSLEAQFAVGWAIGAPVFGIVPVGPLRSLIVQAENDDYDLAEMVQGVASAHGIDEFDPRWQLVSTNVRFRTETASFGARFCSRLRDMIDADRPDVVWVDPLLSYAGIDVSKQDQVTPFLREMLTPVLESTGSVMVGVHHTGKPKDSKTTRDWTAIDWAYAGIGSSELVNWARAVMLLRPVEGRTYELKLAKRGSRSGATHPDGAPAYGSVWLQQAVGRIYWEQVLPPDEPAEETPAEAPRRARGASEPSGRGAGAPSKAEHALAVLPWPEFAATIPADGLSQRKLVSAVMDWMAPRGMSLGKTQIRETILPWLTDASTHPALVRLSDGIYRRA